MKIAAITDDGISISQHFGRAGHYLVCTVEEGKIISTELRDKLGHKDFAGEDRAEGHHGEHDHHHGDGHGHDEASHGKHARMAEAIGDCEVLLCRGMGSGAYSSVKRLGITPILTDIANIEEAVKSVISGTIIDHTELLH